MAPNKTPAQIRIITILLVAFIFMPGRIRAGEITGRVLINSEPADRAVVYLTSTDDRPLSSIPVEKTIRQENLRFKPDFLVVPAGTTIRFENDDNEIHNVYSKTSAVSFDTGAILPHTAKKIVLKEPGIASLRCRTHQNMRGFIFVAPSPYFAVTNNLGQFEIPNVPSGHYRVKTWQSQITPEEGTRGEMDLDLAADVKVVQLRFTVKAAAGTDLTEAADRDWAPVLEQIRTELDSAIALWKNGSMTAATSRVMNTHSRLYGESGLREAITQVFGKTRAEEHERRFDALRKQIQGIGGTEPATEAALRRETNRLIDELTADVKKLTAP